MFSVCLSTGAPPWSMSKSRSGGGGKSGQGLGGPQVKVWVKVWGAPLGVPPWTGGALPGVPPWTGVPLGVPPLNWGHPWGTPLNWGGWGTPWNWGVPPPPNVDKNVGQKFWKLLEAGGGGGARAVRLLRSRRTVLLSIEAFVEETGKFWFTIIYFHITYHWSYFLMATVSGVVISLWLLCINYANGLP